MHGPMTAPRICILTETYHPVVGGGETQARALAEGLAARGHEVILITRRSDPALPRVECVGGIPVHRLPPSGPGHLKKWALLPSSLIALLRLRRSYDLIFVSGFRVLGVAAVLVSRLQKKSCILKADSLGEMSGEFFRDGLASLGLSSQSRLFRMLLALRNRILRHADGFVSISSVVEKELLRSGVPREHVRRIPNSVDVDRFSPAVHSERAGLRCRLSLPARATIVTFVGRLVSYKGLPLLLSVWKDLHAHHPDALLLLVGGGSLDLHNCEQELREYVAEQQLTECVRFTGDVENVADYLRASDAFVFPAEAEAFGIALVEAMACALPVVAARAGGVSDILEPGSGLAVPAGGFAELRDAIDALLRDPSLGARLGESARRTAVDRYSDDAVVGRYRSLFREVAG
jgi:glycosyltransferase involved in cell wall biosynthesis